MPTLTSRNPYTGQINASFETFSNDELDVVIGRAYHSYLTWKDVSKVEKKKLFLKLADLLQENIEAHARLETIEMGRLYTVAKKWLEWTADLIRWYANHFERILADEKIDEDGLTGHVQYDPLGVIYGIAPWNFPYNQLLRAAVPNLLAGNTVIYKHASNVPLCAQAIETLFTDAWFPLAVYNNLFISPSQSEFILTHPAVQWVNLTWSQGAWSSIGSLAGKYLKRSVLELGGNDAFVLLDHHDTDAMVAQAVACRISNGWQRCNASKRFIVLEHHYDAFVGKIATYMAGLKVGDPMDPATQVPPMAKVELVQEINEQVEDSVKQWARLVTGGKIIDKEHHLYAPTVLADVTPTMRSYQEEVFGPVSSVIKSRTIEESINIANDSDFWLSAVVFGDDVVQCKNVARRLEWGMIFVNQPAWSKASLPFGGVKKSGYGKENGADGLKAFVNKKVVLY